MITSTPYEKGFIFLKDGSEIAVGEYYNGSFLLYEDSEENIFTNAMLAFSFLNKKYYPGFYLGPVKKKEPVVEDSHTRITRYKGHIALQTIDKEAFHAWESKHESRHRKN